MTQLDKKMWCNLVIRKKVTVVLLAGDSTDTDNDRV